MQRKTTTKYHNEERQPKTTIDITTKNDKEKLPPKTATKNVKKK